MSQAVHNPLPKSTHKRTVSVQCGDRPGDLRIKVMRRPRGRLEQASLRVRSLVSKVTSR